MALYEISDDQVAALSELASGKKWILPLRPIETPSIHILCSEGMVRGVRSNVRLGVDLTDLDTINGDYDSDCTYAEDDNEDPVKCLCEVGGDITEEAIKEHQECIAEFRAYAALPMEIF